MNPEQIEFRKKARDKYRREFKKAYQNKDKASMKQIISVLNGDLKHTFEELKHKPDYVQALEWKDEKDNDGKRSEKSIQQLIEEDFEGFNRFEGSTLLGGMELSEIENMEPDDLENYKTRWQNYHNTSGFGEGSRSFFEQSKGVGTGIAVDLLSGGFIKSLGMKLFGKAMPIAKIKQKLNTLSPMKKASLISAGLSGLSDYELQQANMLLGLQDEYDPVQAGIATTFGAVAPKATQFGGKVIGDVQRAVLHPKTSVGKTLLKTEKGQVGMAKGYLNNMIEKIKSEGADFQKGLNNFKLGLASSNKTMDDWFDTQYRMYDDAYDSISISDINYLVNNWKGKNILPDDIQKQLDELMERVVGSKVIKEKSGLIRRVDISDVQPTPREAINDIKGLLRDARYKTSGSRRNIIDGWYKDTSNVQRNAVKNYAETNSAPDFLKRFDNLQKLYGEKLAFEKSSFGSRIMGALEDDTKAYKFFDDLTNPSNASQGLKDIRNFMAVLKKIDKQTGGVGLADSFRNQLQNGIGDKLVEKNGAKLKEILQHKEGLRYLKNIYPQDANYYQGLADMSQRFGKKGDGVIYTMTIARLASHTTRGLGFGEIGQTGATLAAVESLTNITEKKWFQNMMMEAVLSKGQRPRTNVSKVLAKKGYNEAEIKQIQDILNALPGTVAAIEAGKEQTNSLSGE